MISVKESLNQIENADRRFRAALESYAAALESIDKHVLPLQPALEPEYRLRLKTIRAAVSEKAPAAAMETARRQLDEALKGYCGKTANLWEGRAEDIRQILLALAGATEALDRQSGGYGEQFRQIAQRIDGVKQLADLSEIRREITGQVAALNTAAARMHKESEQTIAKLQGEMSAVRERLDEVEKLAETDPLTGLLNRRGMERRVAALIAQGRQFSILLLDLNRFKGINDRHGHLCGDEVLALFGARLAAEVRAGDPVGRWGGDEFLAVMCLPYQQAVARSGQISKKICGSYILPGHNGLKLEVSATVGLSPHRPGQTSKEVFAAADLLLCGNKEATR